MLSQSSKLLKPEVPFPIFDGGEDRFLWKAVRMEREIPQDFVQIVMA